MKLDALDHPKTLDLAARLKCSLPQAIGHLELLWAWTGKKAAQGNVGKWPNGAIARACFWDGDPDEFVKALEESGFIDRHPKHRYLIHDWKDHAPRWVKSKLKTEGLDFISPDNGCDTSNDTSDDTSFDTKGREVKGSEEKRERPRKRGTTLPDGFTVSSELIAWAKAKGLTERQISEETEKFCDHHRSKGSVFRDWDAAWRTWIRKHLEWRKERHGIVDIYTPA